MSEQVSEREGTIAGGLLPDGREWLIYPMIFTFRLVVGDPGAPVYDDCWCYHSIIDAMKGVAEWDGTGEPQGWHRHPASGRRRPDGDAEHEYVQR